MDPKQELLQTERKLDKLDAQGKSETPEYEALELRADELADELSKIEEASKERNTKDDARRKQDEYDARLKIVEEKLTDYSRSEYYSIVITNYPITKTDAGYNISSRARDWDVSWNFDSELDAKEKVLFLCDQREYSKFDRTKKTQGDPKLFKEERTEKDEKTSD